jgi:hypothetical protein
MTRYAIVENQPIALVDKYLPGNYTAVGEDGFVFIVGNDVAGWTMDGYVLPRLASGLIFATELLPSRSAS